MVRRVIHLGPSESQGGMATVINNLCQSPPKGWVANSISTHGNSIFSVISRWFFSRVELKKKIVDGEIDVAHIHVTHSISWWRKRGIMRICEKWGIPSVIHIHSGKFDEFCRGIAGISVRKELSKKQRKTIILENRWKTRLKEWIPCDSVVIRNTSYPLANRSNHKIGGEIKLLILSRKSPVKGVGFTKEVLRCLDKIGKKASLVVTGSGGVIENYYQHLDITQLGWVSEDEKRTLIEEADFLLAPSEFEGASMSVIESMASGLPCLVSEVSNETVGVEELVMKSFNPEIWAERIVELSETEQYESMVKSVKKRSQKYLPEHSKIGLGKIYNELIE